MSKSAIVVLRVLLALLSGYVLALGWWYLWMYEAWPGSPHLLHSVWPGVVDGERSYDVTLIEMWVLSGVVVLIFSEALFRKAHHDESQHSE